MGRKNRLNFDRETQCIKSFFGQKFAAPPNHFELLRPCCNRSPKIKTKNIKNYSSILAIVNHWNYRFYPTVLTRMVLSNSIDKNGSNHLRPSWHKGYLRRSLGKSHLNSNYLKQAMRKGCLSTGFESVAFRLLVHGSTTSARENDSVHAYFWLFIPTNLLVL